MKRILIQVFTIAAGIVLAAFLLWVAVAYRWDASVQNAKNEAEQVTIRELNWPDPDEEIPKDKLKQIQAMFRSLEDPDVPESIPSEYRITHFWSGSNIPKGDFGVNADALIRVEDIDKDGQIMKVWHLFISWDPQGRPWTPGMISDQRLIPEQYR